MAMQKAQTAVCPFCQFPIWLDSNANLWELVTCPSCATELELKSLDPPQLDYYWQDDWDDDDDFVEDDDLYAVEFDDLDQYELGDNGWEGEDFADE